MYDFFALLDENAFGSIYMLSIELFLSAAFFSNSHPWMVYPLHACGKSILIVFLLKIFL